MKSTHLIHGHLVEVSVSQGDMSDLSRGRCIGKVVNLLRATSKAEFERGMSDAWPVISDTAHHAAMLEKLDAALAENYTRKTVDDYAPVCSIKVVE